MRERGCSADPGIQLRGLSRVLRSKRYAMNLITISGGDEAATTGVVQRVAKV